MGTSIQPNNVRSMSASEQRCKEIYQEFQKAGIEEKKTFVLKLLFSLKEGNEVLETIYDYVVSEPAVPLSELEEIVRAVVMSNLEIDESKRSIGIQALEQAKIRIVNMRKTEELEKRTDVGESEEVLAGFP